MSAPIFEYDIDLVRDVLIWAEHGGARDKRPEADLLKLCFHVKIMDEAGLIHGTGDMHKDPPTGQWKPGAAVVRMPTQKGLEFLNAVRNDTIWNHVKAEGKKQGIPLLIESVKIIVARYAGQPHA